MDKAKVYFISIGGGLLGLLGIALPWVIHKGFASGVLSGFKSMSVAFSSGTFGGIICGLLILFLILLFLGSIGFSYFKLKDRIPNSQESMILTVGGGVGALFSLIAGKLALEAAINVTKSAIGGLFGTLSDITDLGLDHVLGTSGNSFGLLEGADNYISGTQDLFSKTLSSGVGMYFAAIAALIILGAGLVAMLMPNPRSVSSSSNRSFGYRNTGQRQQPQQNQQWQQSEQPPRWQQPQQPPQWQQPQQPPQWQQPEQPPQWQQPEQPPQWQQPEQPPQPPNNADQEPVQGWRKVQPPEN